MQNKAQLEEKNQRRLKHQNLFSSLLLGWVVIIFRFNLKACQGKDLSDNFNISAFFPSPLHGGNLAQ